MRRGRVRERKKKKKREKSGAAPTCPLSPLSCFLSRPRARPRARTVAQQQQVLVVPLPAHRADDGVQPGDGGGVGLQVAALGRGGAGGEGEQMRKKKKGRELPGRGPRARARVATLLFPLPPLLFSLLTWFRSGTASTLTTVPVSWPPLPTHRSGGGGGGAAAAGERGRFSPTPATAAVGREAAAAPAPAAAAVPPLVSSRTRVSRLKRALQKGHRDSTAAHREMQEKQKLVRGREKMVRRAVFCFLPLSFAGGRARDGQLPPALLSLSSPLSSFTCGRSCPARPPPPLRPPGRCRT